MDDLSSQLNGKKALFSKAPWLDVRRPKDIAPLIFKGFQRRRCSVSKALENNYWITQINMQDGLSLEHIVQFTNLRELLSPLQMDPNTPDSIPWKLTIWMLFVEVGIQHAILGPT
jgi:hypothetical protein